MQGNTNKRRAGKHRHCLGLLCAAHWQAQALLNASAPSAWMRPASRKTTGIKPRTSSANAGASQNATGFTASARRRLCQTPSANAGVWAQTAPKKWQRPKAIEWPNNERCPCIYKKYNIRIMNAFPSEWRQNLRHRLNSPQGCCALLGRVAWLRPPEHEANAGCASAFPFLIIIKAGPRRQRHSSTMTPASHKKGAPDALAR